MKDVERLNDKKEARAEGGRRFQREGPITEKDLDMVMMFLICTICCWDLVVAIVQLK